MRNELPNIPTLKLNELEVIKGIILEKAEIEMLILFGSYARGDWVSDRYMEGHITYEYESDIDLLVVVKNEKLTENHGLWNSIEEEIRMKLGQKTTVSLLVDSIHFINQKLKEGNYFYSDIKKEGVVLYDSKKFILADATQLTPEQKTTLMKKDYEFWQGKAKSFMKDFVHNIEDGELNNGAFHLHQITEALLVSVLLTLSGYRPKTHNIEKILNITADLDERLKNVFPRKTNEEKTNFDLLRRAYVDARYTAEYKITLAQLETLLKEVQKLEKVSQKICEEKINS